MITIANDPAASVTIDLPAQTVTASGFVATFDIDPFTKHCLVNGLDHIALTMRHEEDIDRFEAVREPFKPVTA